VPNRPVTLRRWQIVSAFVVLVVASALVIVWEDGRIDKNARAIARAEATAVAAQRVNATQNQIRRELVRAFHDSDLRLCRQLEALKERIRATVHVDDASFLATLAQIGIQPDSDQARALLAESHARERDTLERFAAIDCETLPSG
jgi:hypothetical protein